MDKSENCNKINLGAFFLSYRPRNCSRIYSSIGNTDLMQDMKTKRKLDYKQGKLFDLKKGNIFVVNVSHSKL